MESDKILYFIDKIVAYSVFIIILSVLFNWSSGELDLTALNYEYVVLFSILGAFSFVWSTYRRKKLERKIKLEKMWDETENE